MATLKLTDIRKSYGNAYVIKGVDLEIEDGEFTVFVGPSGCGKSTLLRMISGLEDITAGTLEIDGQRVNDLPPKERGIAMVFQSYAIFPHMTVRDNMGFGLKMNGHPKAEIAQKVAEATRILKLEEYLDRKPAALLRIRNGSGHEFTFCLYHADPAQWSAAARPALQGREEVGERV